MTRQSILCSVVNWEVLTQIFGVLFTTVDEEQSEPLVAQDPASDDLRSTTSRRLPQPFPCPHSDLHSQRVSD